MSQQGHPQKPLRRDSLPLSSLVDDFLVHTREEDAPLAKYLAELDEAGRRELGGVLGRFDARGRGALDAQQRLFARRVLTRLHRPSCDSLVLANQILDYLDLNHNAVLEEDEVELCIEVFEMFAKADSDNATVSEIELRMLYAVLRHVDTNDNRKLDAHERQRLHDALKSPRAFLEKERRDNPLFREIVEGQRPR
ncbi:MAG: hypothetical protein MUF54_11325 [Polyangiaceae bacterium]|jgi:hypothetical protein|nr:hypothetical protein [Polyangiaceae bacterium]